MAEGRGVGWQSTGSVAEKRGGKGKVRLWSRGKIGRIFHAWKSPTRSPHPHHCFDLVTNFSLPLPSPSLEDLLKVIAKPCSAYSPLPHLPSSLPAHTTYSGKAVQSSLITPSQAQAATAYFQPTTGSVHHNLQMTSNVFQFCDVLIQRKIR